LNIVDSCGWIEYLSDGANASFFEKALKDTENLLVPSITIYEVFKKVLTEKDEENALMAVSLMQQGKIIDLDSSISISAAKISFDLKIPMADSVILATADAYDATIWTQDEHFEGIAGVHYVEK
jgi:predicted nucleic acid-binding protein